MSWSELSDWWRAEISDDSAYESVVTPMLVEVLRPTPGALYLDLGCGEGRVMRTLRASGSAVHGVDLSHELARAASETAVCRLPSIPMRDAAYDAVYSVLTLEHLEDHGSFFSEAARVTKPGGALGLVINHPTWTAPGSTPITDAEGEVLWRPGTYFSAGSTTIPAGSSTVTFHHRSMAELLNSASDAGWCLERMVERPHHELEDQGSIPRLLAARWSLRVGGHGRGSRRLHESRARRSVTSRK